MKDKKEKEADVLEGHTQALTNLAGRTVYDWHKFKPDYVFLTETSAVPFGYMFKEAWKKAYPDEEVPTFYRINPAILPSFKRWRHPDSFVHLKLAENPEYISKVEEFFRKRVKSKDDRVIVYDEWSPGGSSPGAVKTEIIKAVGVDEKNILSYSHDISLGDYSMLKLTKKGTTSRGSSPSLKEKTRRMTPGGAERELRGKILYPKQEGHNLLQYVKELKKIGRKAGEEIRRGKFEEKKTLEGRTWYQTMLVVGFLGSILFLSSNITGNVIGNLNQTSSNWIGGVLFIVGLVGSFFYFRKIK